MGREGPCFHCGVEYTPLWRPGPHEKPVLCNACGSRWRNRGTLKDYFPKHANKETQSCLQGKLPSEVKPLVLAQDNRRLKVEEKVVGPDGTSACEEEIDDISCSGSPGSFSGNCIHIQETTGEAVNGPLWNPNSVPRRKRSKLKQYILSPVERLNGQLYCILQKPDFAITSAYEEDILIYEKDKNIPANEIGLGAMLYIPPSTTTEDSKPQSTTAEKDSSYSSYFRNENSSLIEKYLVNHVAIQNGSSANIDGRVEGNKVSLHHTDTRLRIYSQTALRGSKVGHSVRRPRGRPHISTAQDTLESVKRPRGRPCVSTAQDTLQPVKRPRGRPPGATAQDRRQSVKRPRGRSRVSTTQDTLQSVKRPRGSPHVSTAQDTFQSVKRPRGRPRVSTAQGTLQPVKRPRGRPRLTTALGRGFHSHRLSQTKGIDDLQVQSSTQMDVQLNDTTGIWTIKERKADTLTINIGNNLKLRDCGRIYADPSASTSENKLHSEQDGRDPKL